MKKANIFFDAEKNTVTLEFLGFLNAEEFKQVWLSAMLLIEEKKAAYFYINASQERIIPPGTEEWLVQDFFAIAEKAAQNLGYRLRVARAESEDIFNKLASERSVNHFIKQTKNFDFENFPSVEKALAWLYAK